MKVNEIEVNGLYRARVAGRLTTVRVDAIRNPWDSPSRSTPPRYDVTNLATGRRTTFRSAAKFRCKEKFDATSEDAQQRSGTDAGATGQGSDGRGTPTRPDAGPAAAVGAGPVVAAEVGGDDCESCLGYGHMDENGEPTIDRTHRKCLDCNGTGVRNGW